MRMIKLLVAGEHKELPVLHATDLLAALSLPNDGRGIAIAVNDSVVPKSQWPEHKLRDGDRIEIVKAVQGG